MSQFRATDTHASIQAIWIESPLLSRDGLILVNSEGQVVWVDEATRRRLNGELAQLDWAELTSVRQP